MKLIIKNLQHTHEIHTMTMLQPLTGLVTKLIGAGSAPVNIRTHTVTHKTNVHKCH